MSKLVVKNAQYSVATFDYVKARSVDIKQVATFLGLTPASIAGGVANEYNIRDTYSNDPRMTTQASIWQKLVDYTFLLW
jgi:hypothetical protein